MDRVRVFVLGVSLLALVSSVAAAPAIKVDFDDGTGHGAIALTKDNYRDKLSALPGGDGLVRTADLIFKDDNYLKQLNAINAIGGKDVTIHLIDNTGPHAAGEWPRFVDEAGGIRIGRKDINDNYNTAAGADDNNDNIKGLIAHELSHAQDKTTFASNQPYGPDGQHFVNEILPDDRAAWKEGWGNFNAAVVSHTWRDWMGNDGQKALQSERADKTYADVADPAFAQSHSTESVVARILYGISKLHPDGVDRVRKAFSNANASDHSLNDFLQAYVKNNPDDVNQVAAILDAWTRYKGTADDIKNALVKGNDAAANALRQKLDDGALKNRDAAALATGLAGTAAGPDRPDTFVHNQAARAQASPAPPSPAAASASARPPPSPGASASPRPRPSIQRPIVNPFLIQP